MYICVRVFVCVCAYCLCVIIIIYAIIYCTIIDGM